MKKLIFLLLIVQSLFAQDPAQYGTPFTGVPDPRDAVIYQVNIRAFSSTHNLQGVTNRLDQIRALGVNVVYLMPVQPVGVLNAFNSPYCIRDFDAVGSEFGSLTDLRALVDAAHSRGMAVMMDWVVNQTSYDHPWITQHADWYLKDANGNITGLNGYTDVAALDFSKTAMRTEMIKQMRYWVFTANVDGFRCDFADNPPIDFWNQTISSLRGITTHKLLLLAEGTRAANYSAGFDYNFGMQFYYNSLRPIFTGGSATAIDNSNVAEYAGSAGNQQIVRYLTNHDVDGSDGAPVTLFGGKAGAMAAFVVASYMKGVPFVYNGQEVAFPTAITFPFTSVTIDWTMNPDVTTAYQQILAFHNSSNAIRRGSLVSYTNNDVCAFTKTAGTENVAVFANLRNSTVSYTLPAALANSNWTNVFTGATVMLGSTLTLTPYQYLVLNGGTPVTPPPTSGWYLLLNRYRANTYLYDGGNGQVKYGTTPDQSYQWSREDAGNGYIRLRNRATGNVMHVENQTGAVQCSAAGSDWYSAMWTVTPAVDGWNYLVNRWQSSEWIHLEQLLGYAQYSNPQTGWYSAMWQFVPAAATATADGVQIYPNPAVGGRFTIALPKLQGRLLMTIIDSNGQIKVQQPVSGKMEINHPLPAGVYFIRISGGAVNMNRKLLVL